MITGNKIMDVSIARHVLQTLFSDTRFPLIQHHVDSFDDLLDNGIPTFIRASNPFELEVPGNRMIRVYIGGKQGNKIQYQPPVEENGTAVVPHTCRLENRTYTFSLIADIEIEYIFPDTTTETRTFRDVRIGEIPLMLRSKLCYLSGLDGYSIGECKFELGGYFIISGSEKVLLTQELLGNNMFYAGERKRKAPKGAGAVKSLIEKETPIQMELTDEADYEEVQEYYTGIKTISEDGSRGPYSHFLVLPSATKADVELEKMNTNVGRDNRLAMIQISGFQSPVPVLSVFRALGVTSDRDLYDTILAGVPDKDRLVYDDIITQLILSHEKYLLIEDTTDLEVLASQARNKSRFEVVVAMHEMLFSHVEGDTDDTGALFRRKAYLLGHMLKMAIDVAIDRKPPSDRDNMQFKRLKTSGVLMMEEFRRIYREIGKEMLLRMDRKNTYQAADFQDKQLVNLVQPETVKYYWRDWMMLQGFEKSFKGSWGGRVGIAQELARPSYAAVIHHLRKTDLQIDKSASTAPPRRYYGSQMGLMCPIDSPDGSDIGYKKSLTIMARVTTAFPAEQIKTLLRETGLFRDTADIHPSTWRPEWSKIYINSDLVGVCLQNTEDLHAQLLQARRSGQLPIGVSLAWNRLNNEYKIYSDAGRPIRPVYRENTNPEVIRAARDWATIANHLDYLDAVESDSIRLSLVPFSKTMPSEIHMSFNLSALANLVPYPDHNPGPRSVFSIAQQKQAASWYHTNYMKRFDTIAMMAACPQKPISQTWLYNEMMGAGGCLGYGENAIVAITMYGGHNQEDSVILNGGSLKRGMYKTMYYHSYDIVEDMLEPVSKLQTVIANPLTKEVKRLEGMNYEMLDPNGIIKVDSIVDENTILVGMLSPITTPTGQIVGYRDISVKPKRGQHGRIDAVYPFATQAGLRGVKIRILEERTPVLGDKMASRHSQKGTVGQILDEEDMPFSGTGKRPDIIFNPHGIPTRMTVGQFLEMASNKLGVDLGSFVDATPFTTQNRVQDLKTALQARGFEPYGSEVLYNGHTGEQMEVDIFMGPIYYQRLKHMVEDKINYRDTGPKKLLTRQPTQGRGDEGGLRIGEMERDSLISHGMMKFLNESLMERSDKSELVQSNEAGGWDTLTMPYAMALFKQELESMHIKLNLDLE
jgi:DNA-directed RNA polymerase II subunit RPB2